jgi:regulation of enolase protein 1 (concanavalin A-like superfamily)
MNNTNRRAFLVQALGASCATVLPLAATAAESTQSAPAATQTSGKALFPKMKWFNEPASAKPSGEQLLVTTRPKTDFWRKTFYDYVTNNGHFFYLPVSGDFTFEAKVAGQYKDLYDQAGLMARMDDSNWLKCGLELVDAIGHASVVVTRDYSDWSTVRGVTTKAPVWWRLVRKGSSLEVLYSLDGKAYTSMRLGYLPLQGSVDIGIMCASPEGQGFAAAFDELRLIHG